MPELFAIQKITSTKANTFYYFKILLDIGFLHFFPLMIVQLT